MQSSAGPPPPAMGPAGQFSDSNSKLYAVLMDQEAAHKAQVLRSLPSRRRRINCVPLLASLLLPWALFITCYGVAAFYIRYACPTGSLLFQVVVLVLCIRSLADAWQGRHVGFQEGFFPLHLAAAMTVAAIAGYALGDMTFWGSMGPAFSAEHMAAYVDVDPSMSRMPSGKVQPTRGARFQDAGKVFFKGDVIVDVSRSAAFQMGGLYCVAPIVNPTCKKNCGADFWAVGMNCCAEDGSKFECGAVRAKAAKSGVRLLDESQTPYYRLAVLKAESRHKVASPHPLFFHWVADPLEQVATLKRSAMRQFLVAMLGGFAGNAGLLYLSLKISPALWPW